ncbi:unnamed protein product, partial [Brassica oleracea]
FFLIRLPKDELVLAIVDPKPFIIWRRGSLMVSAESSQECEPTDLTPAKRRGTLTDNLEAAVDQNFFTRTPCSTGIKKEKTEKSG